MQPQERTAPGLLPGPDSSKQAAASRTHQTKGCLILDRKIEGCYVTIEKANSCPIAKESAFLCNEATTEPTEFIIPPGSF